MLTISKLNRWSINYYTDTARTAASASRDLARAGGGLGEYYSERETRTPTWLLAGDTRTVGWLVGLTDVQRAGGEADAELAARWLDDGIAPNGARGRAFGQRGVHGFDLTFCAPKSVSLVRALRGEDDVLSKAIADAHTTALSEAMEYLSGHAGYTRIHNPRTGVKDLLRLPGLAAIAYQHETSRCGDPHLHTHVIVPNRQARADGAMASIDGTSLYHEARAQRSANVSPAGGLPLANSLSYLRPRLMLERQYEMGCGNNCAPISGGSDRCREVPANGANSPASLWADSDLVTTLSQPGSNRGSGRDTAGDDLSWSDDFETHSKTRKFALCPTGGQAGRAECGWSPSVLGMLGGVPNAVAEAISRFTWRVPPLMA